MATPVGHKFRDYTPADAKNPKTRRVNPVSPWQVMVEAGRIKLELSYAKLNRLTGIPTTSLFQWTHTPAGAPPSTRYTAKVNKALARALELDPTALGKAYDDSVTSFSTPSPNPAPPHDGIEELLKILKNSTKKTYKTSEVIKLARMCHGASS